MKEVEGKVSNREFYVEFFGSENSLLLKISSGGKQREKFLCIAFGNYLCFHYYFTSYIYLLFKRILF